MKEGGRKTQKSERETEQQNTTNTSVEDTVRKTKNNQLQRGLELVGIDERHPLHKSYSCKGISPTQNTRSADSDNKEASEEKHMVKTECFIKINSHNYKSKVFS